MVVTEGCTITGGDLSCTGGQLAAGESDMITLTAPVTGPVGQVDNTATVRGNDPDPNPDNDTTTETVEIVDVPLVSAGVGLSALGLLGAGAGLRFRKRRKANA